MSHLNRYNDLKPVEMCVIDVVVFVLSSTNAGVLQCAGGQEDCLRIFHADLERLVLLMRSIVGDVACILKSMMKRRKPCLSEVVDHPKNYNFLFGCLAANFAFFLPACHGFESALGS